jgi:predicted dehydrogenase
MGMSNFHAEGYKASPDAEIVALADISLENAQAFQERHGAERIYTDYHEMLEKEQLDMVSVCTWPGLHAPMVAAAAQAGVRAIHCEKPMAPTYGEALEMVRVCEKHGTQLTFNHQRRFGSSFIKAKELLKSGAIGDLVRMEMSCSNMFDWGTHWFDMMGYYNDDVPAEWVLGQIEMGGGRKVFAVPIEGQGISHIKYQNGVHGLMVTGFEAGWESMNRLIGTEGVIEAWHSHEEPVRMWGKGQAGWQVFGEAEGVIWEDIFAEVGRAVMDGIDALKTGREPELAARKTLQATELIFATYESSRRRGRVELPLNITDSPLLAMLEAGDIVADFE